VEALATLFASRSSDSMRARSPLAAMAVKGSMAPGKEQGKGQPE